MQPPPKDLLRDRLTPEDILSTYRVPSKYKEFFTPPPDHDLDIDTDLDDQDGPVPRHRMPRRLAKRLELLHNPPKFRPKSSPATLNASPNLIPRHVHQQKRERLSNYFQRLFLQSWFSLPHGRFSHLDLSPNLKVGHIVWTLDRLLDPDERQEVHVAFQERKGLLFKAMRQAVGNGKIPKKLRLILDMSSVTLEELRSVEMELEEHREATGSTIEIKRTAS